MLNSIETTIQSIVRQENERLLAEIRNLLADRPETPHMHSKPMTIEEAAAFLHSSKSYVYKLTSENKIPHFKKGKRVYFYSENLESWLAESSVPTVSDIRNRVDSFLLRKEKTSK